MLKRYRLLSAFSLNALPKRFMRYIVVEVRLSAYVWLAKDN